MTEKRVIVLGGGVSGLTVAWRLRELGVAVEVLEAQNIVGGLAGTVRAGNEAYCLDFGPHFFITQKPDIVRRITELLGGEVVSFRRSAQIYFQGRFLDYPLSARNVLLHFPRWDAVASVATYLTAQARGLFNSLLRRQARRPDVAEWATQRFGSHLARLFFRPYTENFWKMPAERLSSDTIPTSTSLNFAKSLKLLLTGRVTREAKDLTERELVLPLRYPTRGFGMIAEAIASRVTGQGGRIHLGAPVTAIERCADGRYQVTARGQNGPITLAGQHVVSTIPLPSLPGLMRPAAPPEVIESAAHLGYLAMIVLYAVIPRRDVLATSYVYYLGKPYHRLSDMNRFCGTLCPPDENMLAVEFSCHQTDAAWKMSAEELLELALPHLEKDGIVRREEIRRLFLVKAAHAYPIFYYDYREHLDNVKNFVRAQPNLAMLGRSGEYRYIDSDQCMERAIALAEKIAADLNSGS
jgi:protoporphyrinogen oxidase